MKYFLDCGAYDGWSVGHFKQSFPDWQEYEIHCFEPDPEHGPLLAQMDGIVFHNQAVWVTNQFRDFYLSDGKGSSLLIDKTTGQIDRCRPVTVSCLDFSKWIINLFKRDDYIVLKMDIEGAEYSVLHKMIDDGSIGYIDRLYVEFHQAKIGISDAGHQYLVERIADSGREIGDWSRP